MTEIDAVISLGGDGTLLHVNTLFQGDTAVPPVISFALGSLGFLTPFPISCYVSVVLQMLQAHGDAPPIRVLVRMRLKCQMFLPSQPQQPNNDNHPPNNSLSDSLNQSLPTQHYNTDITPKGNHPINPENPVPGHILRRMSDPLVFATLFAAREKSSFEHHVLNELIISRVGLSLVALDVYIDDVYSTTCNSDGLIVSTPSGSTAYSMAAGGPMVAPNVPAIVITPVCPHSLSFRPLVLSDSARIKIITQTPAMITCDGREPVAIPKGTLVHVGLSEWALPSIIPDSTNSMWMDTITRKLQWNLRASTALEGKQYSNHTAKAQKNFSLWAGASRSSL